jgi:hypothetical protein
MENLQSKETYVLGGGNIEIEIPLIRIPARIATCPECGADLEAVINVLDPVEPGGYRYKPSIPTLFCQNEETFKHTHDVDGWMNTYDMVGKWLEAEVVAELDPEEFEGAVDPPPRLCAQWHSTIFKP